jgi:hypothetical protein
MDHFFLGLIIIFGVFLVGMLATGRIRGSAITTAMTLDGIYERSFGRVPRVSARTATVLFSDFRMDWRAPRDGFYESRCPFSAVKVLVTPDKRHYLWAYSTTLAPEPVFTLLTSAKADAILADKRGLLEHIFPHTDVINADKSEHSANDLATGATSKARGR